MIKSLRLAAALLTFCALTGNARAGGAGPTLFVELNGCGDTEVGYCEPGLPNGVIPVDKFFTGPGQLTLTGSAVGFGSSAPIAETIFNPIGAPFSAYTIQLSPALASSGLSDDTFPANGSVFLELTNPSSTQGTCGLMSAVSIFCSGLNVPTGGSFGVGFSFMAVGAAPSVYSFALAQGPTAPQAVPEPATLALLGLGLAGLAASRRRKQ